MVAAYVRQETTTLVPLIRDERLFFVVSTHLSGADYEFPAEGLIDDAATVISSGDDSALDETAAMARILRRLADDLDSLVDDPVHRKLFR